MVGPLTELCNASCQLLEACVPVGQSNLIPRPSVVARPVGPMVVVAVLKRASV